MTSLPNTSDDLRSRVMEGGASQRSALEQMIYNRAIEDAAKIADPPLMHRKGKPGLWRRRRAEIAANIRALKTDPSA